MYMRLIPSFLSQFEIDALASLGMAETHLWEPGRQGTGYERLALRSLVDQDPLYGGLARRALAEIGGTGWDGKVQVVHEGHWDMWIIRYPDGSYIPPHKDEATVFGLRHRRLNALVRAPARGGELVAGGDLIQMRVGDGLLFYPDETEHAVSKVEGVRLVFSVGAWLEP